MFLTLLPFLLQVWTADYVPAENIVRSSDSPTTLTYRITAIPPRYPIDATFEDLPAEEARLRSRLDQLRPDVPRIQANVGCAAVTRRRLQNCRIEMIAPDDNDSRQVIDDLLHSIRVKRPVVQTAFLSVSLEVHNPLAGDINRLPCLPTFCTITPPPPPPPPPAK